VVDEIINKVEIMKTYRKKNVVDFVERNFEVHGEFEGVVYHRKRKG